MGSGTSASSEGSPSTPGDSPPGSSGGCIRRYRLDRLRRAFCLLGRWLGTPLLHREERMVLLANLGLESPHCKLQVARLDLDPHRISPSAGSSDCSAATTEKGIEHCVSSEA